MEGARPAWRLDPESGGGDFEVGVGLAPLAFLGMRDSAVVVADRFACALFIGILQRCSSRRVGPGGRFPPSFIHQVIIITGLNKLYDCVFALKMALDAGRAPNLHSNSNS